MYWHNGIISANKKSKALVIMDKDLLRIIEKFNIEGKVKDITPYGEGHINVTYLVTTDKKRYILQKINDYVFPNVEGLMKNICGVTEHLKKKGSETLNIVKTKTGENYLKEGPYRVYEFNENTTVYQTISDAKIFNRIGYAFGTFQRLLSDYDAKTLFEVIPGFHNTPERYRRFEQALKEDVKGRAKTCEEEIKFVTDRKNTLSKVVDGLKDGSIPLRITHNDTKINNILIDVDTGEARAIIDLDTIMPGSLLYDFGDSIRFGAATGREDEKDLSKISLSIELFKAYSEGFCSALKGTITEKEKELLPYSAYLLTIELVIRFLTDYLMGDVYFKINYEDHNLVRSRTQIKLAEAIEKHFGEMEKIIENI